MGSDNRKKKSLVKTNKERGDAVLLPTHLPTWVQSWVSQGQAQLQFLLPLVRFQEGWPEAYIVCFKSICIGLRRIFQFEKLHGLWAATHLKSQLIKSKVHIQFESIIIINCKTPLYHGTLNILLKDIEKNSYWRSDIQYKLASFYKINN